MKTAIQTIHPRFVKGTADKEMYGVFMENASMMEETLRGDDAEEKIEGFSKAGIDIMRQYAPGTLRYPGGNYVSSYNWFDGIGPKEKRPVRINYAHSSPGNVVLDTNSFGMDEFTAYARHIGADPMYTVNLGTADMREAVAAMEYCNHPGGTQLSDMRIANGHKEPYQIKHWCLGNEMDGAWQIGQQTAHSYGHKAREVAKMMKLLTPDSTLILCGSTNHKMKNFPEWDRTVLEYAMPYVDRLSTHHLFSYSENVRLGNGDDPLITIDDIPYIPQDVGRHIELVQAVIDYVKAKTGSNRDIKILMDEFAFPGTDAIIPADLPWTEITAPMWEGFPVLEKQSAWARGFYSRIWCMPFLNALLTGGLFIAALNHADVLAGTNHGFEPARMTSGYITPADAIPYLHVSKFGRGLVLQSDIQSPYTETAHYGPMPSLQTATVYAPEKEELTIFAANMNLRESIAYEYQIEGFRNVKPIELIRLYDDQPLAANTPAQPNRIAPVTLPPSQMGSGLVLPKHSWNVLRFRVER